MKIKISDILFLSFLISFLIFSCKKEEDNLLEDMAYLDKSYIETLLDIRDNRNIKQSIERFMINWSGFKKKYYNINEEDPQWKTDFDTLQDILISSHYYIISGEDKSAGYSIFHDIKYVLSDLRKRNNIDWFFDNLNSIYKLSYRLGELSKVYIEGNVDLSLEEKEKLIMVYYLLNSAIETTIEEFDKSNIFLLQLNQARLEAIKHNINAINNLKQSKVYRTDSIMFKIKNDKLKIKTCSS